MDHLGAGISLLVMVGHRYAVKLGGRVIASQDARGVFPGDGTTGLHLCPAEFALLALAETTFRYEVIDTAASLLIARVPVLHGAVLHLGAVVHHNLYDGGMQLVLIAHRGGTPFEVGDVGVVISHNQRTFKLARAAGIDAEVGAQLHGATHPFGDIDE